MIEKFIKSMPYINYDSMYVFYKEYFEYLEIKTELTVLECKDYLIEYFKNEENKGVLLYRK